MWYIHGNNWLNDTKEGPARVYKIAHATSDDGIEWIKENINIISDTIDANECQALPTVIKHNNKYHMIFCFRHATDFRNNKARGYKLGYAYSENLADWVRDDQNLGIDLSDSGWDSEMMCYPNLFHYNNKVYLLYNGNEFGRNGFGLASLVE